VWSWAEIAARVRAAAAGLREAGIAHGDRILVHSRNGHAMFESMWVAWMLGAVWVPTNFRLTPGEVAYLASSSGARAHLFEGAFPAHAEAAREANPAAALYLNLEDDWEALATGPAGLDYAADVDRDDPCWFFYTSGTTGHPKAAMLTHGQMEFVVTNHLCDLMPATTERDASLVVAPLSHGAGIHALAQVARGAASVLLPGERLDCAEAWRLVETHRISNMFTVPTILTMLARDEAVDRYDHSSLRHVIYAGAPMYRADQVHALRKLGPVLVQYFGLGEVTGNITVLPPELHSIEDDPAFPLGSCGYPRTGIEIAILDAAHQRLPARETGDICIRGPAVFAGYHNNPEANEKAFAGGWFHTGDLGHLDEKASSTSPAARPTCTSPAAPTSIRARSRKPCCCTTPSPKPAWSGCRTRAGANPAPPCWCPAPAPPSTRPPSSPISTAASPATKYPLAVWCGRRCRSRGMAR
jgi:acyl-CoA synthetase (AMP-forming)/AMP-acid ligase II